MLTKYKLDEKSQYQSIKFDKLLYVQDQLMLRRVLKIKGFNRGYGRKQGSLVNLFLLKTLPRGTVEVSVKDLDEREEIVAGWFIRKAELLNDTVMAFFDQHA